MTPNSVDARARHSSLRSDVFSAVRIQFQHADFSVARWDRRYRQALRLEHPLIRTRFLRTNPKEHLP